MESTSDKIWIVVHLLLYTFYLLLQTVYLKLLEAIRSYKGIENIPNGKIRIHSIIWRYKVDTEEIAKRKDFVLSPGYMEDSEVLDDPHWTIYTIEENYVLFVLLPEPIHKYNITAYPFIFVPLFEKALAVAEVSRSEFLKFADKLSKNPQPSTVLYTNTARCGSTLFGRMLHRPGISVCYAEHPALTVLTIALGEELMSECNIRTLLHATITCLRAHIPVHYLCILKTQSFEARLVPLCEGIPNLKHIFMFRKRCLLSVERAFRRTGYHYTLLMELYNISPHLARFIGTLVAGEGKWMRLLRPRDMRAMAAIVLGSPLADYQLNKVMYCHPIVWYHEVLDNTEEVLTSVFTELGIPLTCVEDAVQCKLVDSQEDSFLSRESLKHIQLPPVSDCDRALLGDYARRMGVPQEVFETGWE